MGEGRILGIDLGAVRVGLALSDPLGITAQPLQSMHRVGPRKDLDFLAKIVRENDVKRVVVGLPLMLSGEEGRSATVAREFAGRLQARLKGLPVELWDERLTTVEAERTLVSADVSRRKRKNVVDAMAAVLILQSYMEARSVGFGSDR